MIIIMITIIAIFSALGHACKVLVRVDVNSYTAVNHFVVGEAIVKTRFVCDCCASVDSCMYSVCPILFRFSFVFRFEK